MFQQIYDGKQFSTNIRNKHSIPNRFNNFIEPKICGQFWWGRIKSIMMMYSQNYTLWMQISNQKQEKESATEEETKRFFSNASWSLDGFNDPKDPYPKYDPCFLP